MPAKYHPPQKSVVLVRFDSAFKAPEMVKPRLCVVLSPPMKARPNICTVVPLSLSPPPRRMPYHCTIRIPFQLPPRWGDAERWVKGDMVYAAGLHRVELLNIGRDGVGKRKYQTTPLPDEVFVKIQRCVLHGMGLSILTKHL